MKKLSPDHYVRQARIARRRLKAYLRDQPYISQPIDPDPLASILHRDPLVMPEKCSLAVDDINEALQALRSMNERLSAGHKVLLDFANTRFLSVVYAVCMYAEIQTFQQTFGVDCIRINMTSLNGKVRLVLKATGLLNLANRLPLNFKRQRFLPIICGSKDDNLEKIVNYIVGEAVATGNLSVAPEKLAEAEHLASRAVGEAMLNVYYHAYPNSQKTKLWWCTAAIFDGDLYLAFCDRGVGIPTTLPRATWWEYAMGLLPINDDAEMIQAAMRYTRSAAKKKSERGLGTKDMQRLILRKKAGYMTIVSGRGHYKLESGANGEESIFNTDIPIIGTAINWRIPLGA